MWYTSLFKIVQKMNVQGKGAYGEVGMAEIPFILQASQAMPETAQRKPTTEVSRERTYDDQSDSPCSRRITGVAN